MKVKFLGISYQNNKNISFINLKMFTIKYLDMFEVQFYSGVFTFTLVYNNYNIAFTLCLCIPNIFTKYTLFNKNLNRYMLYTLQNYTDFTIEICTEV